MDQRSKADIIHEVERGTSVEDAAAKAGVSAQALDEALSRDLEFRASVERAKATLRAALRRRLAKSALEGDTAAAAALLSEGERPLKRRGTFPDPDKGIDPERVRQVTRAAAEALNRGAGETDEGDG